MRDSLIELDHLLYEVCREHHTRARTLFHKLGLYRGQPTILKLLWERDGQTQTELATAMRIQPATVNKMIQRMEQSGFLTRNPDPDDHRVSRVYLTERANQVRPELDNVIETLAHDELRDFTPEERMLLRRFLIHLRDNLRQVNGTE